MEIQKLITQELAALLEDLSYMSTTATLRPRINPRQPCPTVPAEPPAHRVKSLLSLFCRAHKVTFSH